MFKRKTHRVGGKPFEHSSGLHDPVAVIAEHTLPPDLTPEIVQIPHGYRARTIGEPTGTDQAEHVGDHVERPRRSA
jgi:hypothetical protein